MDGGPRDSVDALLASWRARRADLDFGPLAVVARLNRVRGHIDGELERVFAANGLGAADFAVLVTLARIGEEGSVSQRRLMDELGLTSGTVSVRIDRLVEEGLVERGADPESRRTVLITLTERGRTLFERVVPAHLANERRLLAALSAKEQEQLAGLLRRLLVEFEGSSAAAGAPMRLGLSLAPAHVTMAMRDSVGLPPAIGLLVRSVEEGGLAAQAGVCTGDVLLRAGGHELRAVCALYAALDEAEADRLRLTVLRGVDEHRVTVRLGAGAGRDPAPAAGAGRFARGRHEV